MEPEPVKQVGTQAVLAAEEQLDHRALTQLLNAGRSLVSELDLEVILRHLLQTATEVSGAQYAAIGVLDSERRELERFITHGIDESTRKTIGELPRGRGVLGVLIDDPKPLRLKDVGKHPQSYGFPAGHPPMRTFLGVPIIVEGRAWGNLYLTEKEGGVQFTAADEQSIKVLADWASIAINNARLYETVRTHHDELAHAVRALEATTTIARAIGSETDLSAILELVVKRARALVNARAVVLLLADGRDLSVSAVAGQVASDAIGRRITRAGSAAGEVLEAGEAEIVPDVATRLALDENQLGVVSAETALLVPLVYREARLGVLAAFDHLGGSAQFNADHESLLLAFAASAATAVATGQDVAAERLRHSIEAAESERRRWARELHDETLQALGGLRMLLSSALGDSDPSNLEAAVREAVDHLGSEVESLRTLITELRPAALDELGVVPAIESLVKRVAGLEGLEYDLDLELGETRLLPQTETALYRVIQEALSNVTKHAAANRVAVSVKRHQSLVEVEVFDDGRGFDPDAQHEGFGLVGIRERLALIGGTVEIVSSSRGTAIRAKFPYITA